jgi:hypothetical protein
MTQDQQAGLALVFVDVAKHYLNWNDQRMKVIADAPK